MRPVQKNLAQYPVCRITRESVLPDKHPNPAVGPDGIPGGYCHRMIDFNHIDEKRRWIQGSYSKSSIGALNTEV